MFGLTGTAAVIATTVYNLVDDTLDSVQAVADNGCIWKKVDGGALGYRITRDEAEKLTGYPKTSNGPGTRVAGYIRGIAASCGVPEYARWSIESKIYKGFDNKSFGVGI